ncbi:REP-associated tyrosine transposase [Endothiovibrio diazotrophicus]
MVGYRRNFVPGGSFFFTVTLRDRRSNLLVRHVDELREAVRAVKRTRPFEIVAMVVLPDHIHALWVLPEGDSDYPGRWRAIKSRFTRALVQRGLGLMRDKRGEYRFWQRRYWEHTIRDDEDLTRHVDYIHYNPVKHGHVGRVRDWPHSSFHRFVADGRLPPEWGEIGPPGEEGLRFGE